MSYVRKWYMADPHFGHQAMMGFCPETRPFASVHEMDQAIIDRVNERVSKSDILYILGDFAFGKDEAHIKRCFHSLNGRKVLIIGNHDVDRDGALKPVLATLPWDQAPVHSLITSDNGTRLFLAHYAHRAWPGQHKGAIHLYGHSHGRLPQWARSRDVGLDVADMGFGPMTMDFIAATLPAHIETGEIEEEA